MQCELCDREMQRLTEHHLIPRQSTKRNTKRNTKRKQLEPSPTIAICSACHRQIHALFDNKYLATELNSLDKLQNDLQMQKFLTWIRKQNPDKRVKVRK